MMTCSALRLDGVPFAGFSRRQAVQLTSSGEAEFYGAGSVLMDGRVVTYVLQWLGYKVDYVLLLYSSAAKAMAQRDGVGKVKHLDVRALWLQAERRDHGLITKTFPGEEHLADLGTKAHPVTRFVQLRDMCGIVDCGKIDEHEEIDAMAIERVDGAH